MIYRKTRTTTDALDRTSTLFFTTTARVHTKKERRVPAKVSSRTFESRLFRCAPLPLFWINYVGSCLQAVCYLACYKASKQARRGKRVRQKNKRESEAREMSNRKENTLYMLDGCMSDTTSLTRVGLPFAAQVRPGRVSVTQPDL